MSKEIVIGQHNVEISSVNGYFKNAFGQNYIGQTEREKLDAELQLAAGKGLVAHVLGMLDSVVH